MDVVRNWVTNELNYLIPAINFFVLPLTLFSFFSPSLCIFYISFLLLFEFLENLIVCVREGSSSGLRQLALCDCIFCWLLILDGFVSILDGFVRSCRHSSGWSYWPRSQWRTEATTGSGSTAAQSTQCHLPWWTHIRWSVYKLYPIVYTHFQFHLPILISVHCNVLFLLQVLMLLPLLSSWLTSMLWLLLIVL